MKQIVIDVANDGEIKIETRGFTGKACIEETQFLKDLLGQETARELKPCYFQQEKQKITRHIPLCG